MSLRTFLAVVAVGFLAGIAMADISVTYGPGGVQASDLCAHRRPDGTVWIEMWGSADAGADQKALTAKVDPYSGPALAALNNALDGPATRALTRAASIGDAGSP